MTDPLLILFVSAANTSYDSIILSVGHALPCKILRLITDAPELLGKNPDSLLAQTCRQHRPDLVVFIPSALKGDRNPSAEALAAIERNGIPVVPFYLDLAKPFWQQFALHYSRATSLSVSIDGAHTDALDQQTGAPILKLFTPILPATSIGPKTIDVSLLGSIAQYPQRAEHLAFLHESGVAVTTGGGHDGNYEFSVEQYFDIVSRSKIVINFSLIVPSAHAPAAHQLKGRVLEAVSRKALLLESRNDVTGRYFNDGEHIVFFDSKENLRDLIRYYLARDGERNRIAEAAHRHYLAHYTAGHMWRTLLSAPQLRTFPIAARIEALPGMEGSL